MKKYKDSIKIVAMHHHLIAIPDTGLDQLTVVDAGDVLRTVLRADVDVVLCGHKHRPWAWNFGRLKVVVTWSKIGTQRIVFSSQVVCQDVPICNLDTTSMPELRLLSVYVGYLRTHTAS